MIIDYINSNRINLLACSLFIKWQRTHPHIKEGIVAIVQINYLIFENIIEIFIEK